MCGIAGIFRVGRGATALPDDALRTGAMLRHLVHRGPDDGAVCTTGAATLGIRRLAIVDPIGGVQPFSEQLGTALVYNGEIYNHVELRREIESRDIRFVGRSDSEVLFHLLRLRGVRCLGGLTGMFALAFYDASTQSTTLAVDPFGIKPLFWTKQGDEVVFASELKALLVGLRVQPALDLDWFVAQRALGWVRGGVATPFAGVSEVRPGTSIELTVDGDARERSYWSLPDFQPTAEGDRLHLEEVASALVAQVVGSHVPRDVPAAMLLSGGVDSSLVCRLARQQHGAPTEAFVFGYAHNRNDDVASAERVAAMLDIRLHASMYDPSDALIDLNRAVAIRGEPGADLTALPVQNVFRSMHESGYRVCLTGEGADEMFGGYQQLVPALSGPFPRTLDQLLDLALTGASLFTPGQLAVRDTFADAVTQLRSTSDCARGHLECEHAHAIVLDDGTAFSRLLVQTTMRRLCAWLDRHGMAHAVECRVPFCDKRVAAFCLGRPISHLLYGPTETKSLLRAVAARSLPIDIAMRPKLARPWPMKVAARWLRRIAEVWLDAPNSVFHELLNERSLAQISRDIWALDRELDANNADDAALIVRSVQFASYFSWSAEFLTAPRPRLTTISASF